MKDTLLTPAAETVHFRTADRLADDYLLNLAKFEEKQGARFPTLGKFWNTPYIRSNLLEFFSMRASAGKMPRLTPRWDSIEAAARAEIRRRLQADPILGAKLLRIRAAEKAGDEAEYRAAIAAMPVLPLRG